MSSFVSLIPYHHHLFPSRPTLAQLGTIEDLGVMFCNIGPAWFRRLVVEFCPIPAVQELNRIVKDMHRMSMTVYEQRRHLLAEASAGSTDDIVCQHDMLSLLRMSCASSKSDRGIQPDYSPSQLTSYGDRSSFGGRDYCTVEVSTHNYSFMNAFQQD